MSDLILNIGKTPNKVYFLVIFHDCMLFYRFNDFKPLLTLYLILRFVFLAYFLLLQKHVYLFNYRTFRLNCTFPTEWTKFFVILFLKTITMTSSLFKYVDLPPFKNTKFIVIFAKLIALDMQCQTKLLWPSKAKKL